MAFFLCPPGPPLRLRTVASISAELLLASAADRASRLKAVIDHDGEVVRGRDGIRAHPALKEELACRGFIVRTLHRLGLDVEAVRSPGRPGSAVGWVPPSWVPPAS
jgi:hypothetical protein